MQILYNSYKICFCYLIIFIFYPQESCRARSLGSGVYRKHYGACGQEATKGARNYMYRK